MRANAKKLRPPTFKIDVRSIHKIDNFYKGVRVLNGIDHHFCLQNLTIDLFGKMRHICIQTKIHCAFHFII